MKNTVFFDTIPILATKDQVYRRLGFREAKTVVSARQAREIERYMQKAARLVSLKGAASTVAFRKEQDSRIVFSKKILFESRQLAMFLERCEGMLLFAATAGKEIMEAVKRSSKGKDVTEAVVLDAVASETVDAALDWIMGYFNRQLLRENRRLTRNRFSAGYGDFLLENQKKIYDILTLKRLGIAITPECILVPEKSVTAIAGIRGMTDERKKRTA